MRFCASPAPMPRIARPCETRSSVMAARAMFDGWRRMASVTHVPSSTLRVMAAIDESMTHGSRTIALRHCGTFVWSM